MYLNLGQCDWLRRPMDFWKRPFSFSWVWFWEGGFGFFREAWSSSAASSVAWCCRRCVICLTMATIWFPWLIIGGRAGSMFAGMGFIAVRAAGYRSRPCRRAVGENESCRIINHRAENSSGRRPKIPIQFASNPFGKGASEVCLARNALSMEPSRSFSARIRQSQLLRRNSAVEKITTVLRACRLLRVELVSEQWPRAIFLM